MLKNITARDIVAFITMIGGLGLMYSHINGLVGGLLVTVIAFYFGLNTQAPKDKE